MDEFNDPFAHTDPFFARPLTMPVAFIDLDRDQANAPQEPGKMDRDGQPEDKREEERVTKQASAEEQPLGFNNWLTRGFRANLDVTETKDNFSVAMDVPGIKPGEKFRSKLAVLIVPCLSQTRSRSK